MKLEDVVLQIKAMDVAYPGHTVFKDFSCAIKPGVSLVCGAEGRGKTSLLRAIAGELPVARGRILLNGVDLIQHPAYRSLEVFWADPRNEAHHQITSTAWFGAVPAQFAGFDPDLLKHLTDGLGLQEHLAKPLYMLSMGSRRKVWLAGALASGAALTLIDEPFGALDKRSIAFLLDFLEEAAGHLTRAWFLADYEAPPGLSLAGVIDLGD
jgi:ABC-type multidrug transport system ATPase subunit